MEGILIVLPTVTGREEHFNRCITAYAERTPGYEPHIVATFDQPTWGQGIRTVLEQVGDDIDTFEYIHFTADDLEPMEGWAAPAVEAAKSGVVPAPYLMDTGGEVFYGHPPTRDMADWKPTLTSTIPFMRVRDWKKCAPMCDWHFFTDDFISHRARSAGLGICCRSDYRFVHHVAQERRGAGMSQDQRMHHDHDLWIHYLQSGEVLKSTHIS